MADWFKIKINPVVVMNVLKALLIILPLTGFIIYAFAVYAIIHFIIKLW